MEKDLKNKTSISKKRSSAKILIFSVFLILMTVLATAPFVFSTGYNPNFPSHTPLYADVVTGRTGSTVSVADNFLVTGDVSNLGKVGIGVVGPTSFLQIVGNISLNALNSNGIIVTTSGAVTALHAESSTTGTVNIRLKNSLKGWAINNIGGAAGGDFSISEDGASTRLTIQKNTGNVGIGATAPVEFLTVNGNASVSNISIKNTANGLGVLIFNNGSGVCIAGC